MTKKIDVVSQIVRDEIRLDPRGPFGAFSPETVPVISEQIAPMISGDITVGKVEAALERWNRERVEQESQPKPAPQRIYDPKTMTAHDKLELGNRLIFELLKTQPNSVFYEPGASTQPATPGPALTPAKKLAQANDAAMAALGWKKPDTK